jgi:hypothetical protein
MKTNSEVDKTMEGEKVFQKEEFKRSGVINLEGNKMNLVKSSQENLGEDKKNFTDHNLKAEPMKEIEQNMGMEKLEMEARCLEEKRWKEKEKEKEEEKEKEKEKEEIIRLEMLVMKANSEVGKSMEQENMLQKEEFKRSGVINLEGNKMNLVKSGQENLGLDKKNFTVHKILKEVEVPKDQRQHIKPLMRQKVKEEEWEIKTEID